MKKTALIGLIVLVAGGALIAATALEKNTAKPASKPEVAAATNKPVTEAVSQSKPDSVSSTETKVAEAPSHATVEPIIFGKPDAPVVVEEFASFTCSHCAEFHKDSLPEFTKTYLEKGEVQLQLQSFVRNEQDLRATLLVYCVKDNEERQKFVKALMNAQEQWAFSADFLNNLRIMAQIGGVSNEQFDACMADKALEDKLLANRGYATGLGLEGTPFFAIGKEAIKGAHRVEDFKQAIADAKITSAKKAGK
jgi:protein-disulfide isomerase